MSALLPLLPNDSFASAPVDGLTTSSESPEGMPASGEDAKSFLVLFSEFLDRSLPRLVRAKSDAEEADAASSDSTGAERIGAPLPLSGLIGDPSVTPESAMSALEETAPRLAKEMRLSSVGGALEVESEALGRSREDHSATAVSASEIGSVKSHEVLKPVSTDPALEKTLHSSMRRSSSLMDEGGQKPTSSLLINEHSASLDDVLLTIGLSVVEESSAADFASRAAYVRSGGPSFGPLLADLADALAENRLQVSFERLESRTDVWARQDVAAHGHRSMTWPGMSSGATTDDAVLRSDRTPILDLQLPVFSVALNGSGQDAPLTTEEETENFLAHMLSSSEFSLHPSSSAFSPLETGVQAVGMLRLFDAQRLHSFGLSLEQVHKINQIRTQMAEMPVSHISLALSEFGADASLHVGLVSGKVVHARIVISDAATREALASHLENLKATLEHRGYEVGRIRVLAPGSLDSSVNSGRDLGFDSSRGGSETPDRNPMDRSGQHFQERRQRSARQDILDAFLDRSSL